MDGKNTLFDTISNLGMLNSENRFEKILENIFNNPDITIKLDTIIRNLKDFKDKKKLNIYRATVFLDKKQGFNDIFLNDKICPPIFYFLDGKTMGEILEFENYIEKDFDINKILFSLEIKEYYLKQMDLWIEDETDDYIKCFIDEIKFNFQNDNIYSTTLNLFTLIEFKVRNVYDGQISNGKITKTINSVLSEQCFKYKEKSKLIKIYDTFLASGELYLYKNTKENPKYITRHMLHGEKLDLIDKKGMLSLVFFTDCIFKMLFKIEK